MNENLFGVLFALIVGLGIVMHTLIIYSIGVRHGMGVYTKVESFILGHAYIEDEDGEEEPVFDYYDDNDVYIGKYIIKRGYRRDDE